MPIVPELEFVERMLQQAPQLLVFALVGAFIECWKHLQVDPGALLAICQRTAAQERLDDKQVKRASKRVAFSYEPWSKSMKDEYDSLIENGVWTLVLLAAAIATGTRIISGKWVWKNKLEYPPAACRVRGVRLPGKEGPPAGWFG